MEQKLNALIIANKVVFPTLDGGALAIKKLVQVVANQNYNIDLLSIQKNNNLKTKNITPIIKKKNNYIRQIIFEKNMSINFYNIITSLTNKLAYQALRFYNYEIHKFIQKLVDNNNYEIVIFESIFSTIYLKKIKFNQHTKIIFRAHNIENKIWLDLAKNHILKRGLYLFLSRQIEHMEKDMPKYVDYILTLSDFDFHYFNSLFSNKTFNFPVTFDIKKPQNKKINNSIVHLGAMDWKPNIDGMKWFFKHVKPNLEKSKKNIKIFIAGKKMPQAYFAQQNTKTYIQDKVKNAQDYIANKTILFVPIFSGSGIRIKILEAMSLGVPVVSTSKGAAGIPYTHKKDIFIANTPNEFENAIYKLLENEKLRQKITKNGQLLIKNFFSTKVAIKKWQEILN